MQKTPELNELYTISPWPQPLCGAQLPILFKFMAFAACCRKKKQVMNVPQEDIAPLPVAAAEVGYESQLTPDPDTATFSPSKSIDCS